jgi:predicted NAD-dependent protein-ADP-ribosyltransferase YbiA (DUF1768 family)
MVLSKINRTVDYLETRTIYKDDLELESNLYEVEILGVHVVIAIGKPKNMFESKNILFFPIYLIKYNKKAVQIGVYEIKSSHYANYLDDENALDVERLKPPLLYSFATKHFLMETSLKPGTESESSESESESESELKGNPEDRKIIQEERADIFVLTKGAIIPKMLEEETSTNSKDANFAVKEGTNWVEKFMKNNHYMIVDNEGGGDCFFATIRDAFSSIGQQTTVAKLRDKLAKETTEEIFLHYKEHYDMYRAELIAATNIIKELETEFHQMKCRFQQSNDRSQQLLLSSECHKVRDKHQQFVEEKRVTSQLLQEFSFMKGVDSLKAFQTKIKTCAFWADTWAVSTMERALNIKLVILSSDYYRHGDVKNVLQCGQLNDSILEQRGRFTPDYYIIIEHTGQHYKTIGYKDRLIFTFAELPFSIKKLIYDRCMERNSGPFAIIPDFQRFRDEQMNGTTKKRKQKEEKEMREEFADFEELKESSIRNMYRDDVILQFYSKSNDKPFPGKGTGEKINSKSPQELLRFKELANIPEWRRKLSDFWVQPFTLDDHHWATVEHYYQASKFKREYPEFYLSFSLDSKTDLSKDPIKAKAAGSKSGKLVGELFRPIQVRIDPEFTEEKKEKVLREAQYAKFYQNDALKKLLLATQDAKLMSYIKGAEPVICDSLMIVRDKLGRE